MQLDAPSAAPGWPVESRSVCPVLCGAFRAVFFRGASLPMVSRLGGGLMERLVSRGAARRSKNVVAVALVALAFPPPGTTSASPAIPVSGNSHGRPWGHSNASGDCCPGSGEEGSSGFPEVGPGVLLITKNNIISSATYKPLQNAAPGERASKTKLKMCKFVVRMTPCHSCSSRP